MPRSVRIIGVAAVLTALAMPPAAAHAAPSPSSPPSPSPSPSSEPAPSATAPSARVAAEPLLQAADVNVRVEPGENAAIRPAVWNNGTGPAEGLVLMIPLPEPLIGSPLPANCQYEKRLVCVIDEVVEPGAIYTFSAGIPLRVPADAARNSTGRTLVNWYTAADWAAGQLSTSGTLEFAVDGNPNTGIEVISAEVRGRVGDTVRVRVGWRNNGPGVIYGNLFEDARVFTRVMLPATGITVVDDGACPFHSRAEIFCRDGDAVFRPGEGGAYDIALRIDAGATGEDGVISLNEEASGPSSADGGGDNIRALKITVLAGGGTHGGGPTLPITGPDAGLLALAGSLMVLTGTMLIRIGRRRVVHG